MRRLLPLLVALLAAWPAFAFDIEEFDDGFGAWTASPKRIGQSSTPGWAIVRNDGERAARNSTTGTRYTYYWKLFTDIDLTDADGAELDVKWEFRGHGYEYAAIQIGPLGARRNADFTTLYRVDAATGGPEELRLDLSAWEGGPATVRVVLKKPYNVVEGRIGLYVHRIGVVVPPPPPPPADDPDVLHVGAFNVQVFGLSKMGIDGVPEALVETLSRYDLLLFQEIRDASGAAFDTLLTDLNAATGNAYDAVLSPRLGRTASKEQYAWVYRVTKLDLLDSYIPDDPADVFEREPMVVRFQTVDGAYDFAAIGLHTDPDAVPAELGELPAIFDEVVGTYDEDDVLILGDFNAGCRYLSDATLASLELRADPAFSWWTPDSWDTTTSATVCPYDRLITTGTLTDAAVIGSAQVFLFDQALGLGPRQTRNVSDHYPVELLVDLGRLPLP